MANITEKKIAEIKSSPVVYVSHPTGKLHDTPAITTSCLCNKFCERMHNDKRLACANCYAYEGLKRETAARLRYARNTELLSMAEIPDDLVPNFYHSDIARFETHGDWVNLTHAQNELKIARFNPCTQFTAWTKRADLLVKLAKSGIVQPENFHVKFSSPFLNETASENLKKFLAKHGWNVTFFTVYNLKGLIAEYGVEYLREHGDEVITCGGRDCRSCMKCYGNHPMTDVVELLKQDVHKAKKLGIKIGQ